MIFSSITFLYWFLAAVILFYFAVPTKAKNYVLLASSFLFYFWGEPSYCILMVTACIIGYAAGLLLERTDGTKWRKPVLFISNGILLAILGFFKYANFAISTFIGLTGIESELLDVLLPIGISFYTFQIISYVVDVYRREVPAQRNPFTLATYISLFPQLIAGPIVRYQTVADELKSRTHSFEKFSSGVGRFVIGLSKKVLLADTIAAFAIQFGKDTVLACWLSAICFMFQVYFDFSGYSDMAIGLGRMFGFNFMENFNYPYISRTIAEFWRRWHISLGTWFRDYVYIPLGGNRCSKMRWFFNILVVWSLTGLWHGAAWNFVVWGLFFAFFLLIEKLFLDKLLSKLPKFIGVIYVLFFVNISFVIFNAESMSAAFTQLGGMFGFTGLSLSDASVLYYLRSAIVLLIIAAVMATPYPMKLINKLYSYEPIKKISVVVHPLAIILLLAVCTGFIVDGSFSPFLYFRF